MLNNFVKGILCHHVCFLSQKKLESWQLCKYIHSNFLCIVIVLTFVCFNCLSTNESLKYFLNLNIFFRMWNLRKLKVLGAQVPLQRTFQYLFEVILFKSHYQLLLLQQKMHQQKKVAIRNSEICCLYEQLYFKYH